MGAYDTFTAVLSGAGLVLLGIVTIHGTSEYHLNAVQMQDELQNVAEQSLSEAGQSWATVEMKGQTAILSGAPPNPTAAEAATIAVRESAGKGGYVFGGISTVETQFGEIRESSVASPYVWRAIKSPKGSLILVGSVPNETVQSELVGYVVQMSDGTPDNRLKLAQGAPETNWLGTAKFGLDQLALLDSGEVRLTDYEVRLSGIAMDDYARIQATASIVNLSDPWSGVADIEGPSLWKAQHINGNLVLSGSCESLEERAEIAEIAQSYFDGPVIDDMTVATSEYTDWIEGVRLGLPHFSKFEAGEMEFQPSGDGFRIEGEATGSTLQFLREDMAKLNGQYAVNIKAETVTVALEEVSNINFNANPLQACQSAFDVLLENNPVMFDPGSAEISRANGVTLDKIMAVSALCADTLVFEIGGHADASEQAGNGGTLSQARAEAVADYMHLAGFDTARLSVKGYGAQEPRLDNAASEGQAANRRIEVNVQEWSE